jgi:hypothetical protein
MLVSTRKAAEAAVLTDNDGYKSDIVTPLAIHCGFSPVCGERAHLDLGHHRDQLSPLWTDPWK